ncbi:MAG: DEAD/DEAH box helicase family protein [Pseudanabaena sp. CAN_BIN31]|nr:DEAD/DEAH box helicase family protein [Pseudanabaena sp. CAN_BIN31]
MKLQFSATQDYQLQAVKSVIDLFEGQPLAKGDFKISFAMEGASIAFSEKGIGNNLVISEEQILQNLQIIQQRNNLEISENLVASYSSEDKKTEYTRLNFTIEMETGTGKTYTFLRTIYELNKVYGFKKFVIVVPSVAIREGTVKNLQITHEHFQDLYECPPINYVMYDSKNLTSLKNFATSNAIQVLVINIDSFSKDSNIINTVRETGVKPIEYIQATNEIAIIDEPQNMETDVRRSAIQNLNPLCTLRYSATHRNFYNLLYSLNPVQAYDLGLVKQIEVDGITSDSNYNAAFIQVKKIESGKKNLKVKVAIYVNDKGGVTQKDITLALGEDLFEKSNRRDIYKDGFILNEIRVSDREIEFANGLIIREGETQGGLTDEVMKFQIERTVQAHFEKLKKLKPQGIKVLSLFFIDKVANYRSYDLNGNPEKGKFALWFEEAFIKQATKKANADLIPFEVEKVHKRQSENNRSFIYLRNHWDRPLL